MTTPSHDREADTDRQDSAAGAPDDERRSKAKIEQTGEPDTDRLGNESGAS